MSIIVRSHMRKGRRVSAYTRKQAMSRMQRLSSIEGRLMSRKSNSGMRGIKITENRLAKIRKESAKEFNSPAEQARRAGTKITFKINRLANKKRR